MRLFFMRLQVFRLWLTYPFASLDQADFRCRGRITLTAPA